jgi:hypothetical protein
MFKITLSTYDLDETRSMIDDLATDDCAFTMVHITDGFEGGSYDVAIFADNMYSVHCVATTFDIDIDDIESVDTVDMPIVPKNVIISDIDF